MQLALEFSIFFITYIVFEFVYLSLTSDLYKRHFAAIQNKSVSAVQFNMLPWGIVCYIVLLVVIWFFVISSQLQQKTIVVYRVFVSASLLALAIYGVYNLTNLATLGNYSWKVALQDVAWGLFVINTTCLITLYLHAKIRKTHLVWK